MSNDAVDPQVSAARAAPDSEVLLEANEGQIANIGTYLFCLAFIWLVLPIFWAVYRYLVTATHTFQISSQRLKESSGLIFRISQELELYRVQDIVVERPFLQGILGMGRVVLLTSDRTTPKVIINAIQDPGGVANMIRDLVENCRVDKGVREIRGV